MQNLSSEHFHTGDVYLCNDCNWYCVLRSSTAHDLLYGTMGIVGVEAGSPAAAVKALAQNNLEWAWGQYAQYGIFAMALGIAIYNYKQPSRASSFLYLINGKPANKKINNIVDILCLFGIVSGVTCSLGTGTMQISAGLNSIFGIEPSKFVWLIVEIIIVAGFLLMSIGGIAKGIKIITDRNLELYILVLIFVIGFGPTLYVF